MAPMVLGELQGALGGLLRAAPAEISKAVHVERAFAIDHQTGWQVYQVVTAENPLAAVGHVPSPTAIQRLIKSATRRRVSSEIVRRAADAYEAFDAMVRSHAQDRAEFDAMVRALLPEEQRKQWLASKQAVFKGTSQIRGVAIDTFLQARFLFPSADGTHIDAISLSAELGLRRLHPAAKIGFGIMPLSSDAFRPRSLDGKESDGPAGLMLEEFCSRPLPRFETVVIEGAMHYWVVGNDMGLQSAIDLAAAYRAEARWPRVRGEGKTHVGVHEVMDVPTGRLTFDVFAHQDLFGGAAPELSVYQTVAHGVVHKIGDPMREDDRLHLGDTVQPIAGGVTGAALGHAPSYQKMLEYACERTGCRASAFRGWRVDVLYPFYGAQYSMRFALPEARAGG